MAAALADELPPGVFEHTVARALDGHRAYLARLAELGDDPLAAFLAHVHRTVPFYRAYGTRLADFPVIDRDTARDRRSEMLSTTHAGDVGELWAKTNGTLSTPLVVGLDAAAYYELYQFAHARIATSRSGLRERLVAGQVGIHYVTDIPEDPRLTAYLPALGGVLLRRLPLGRDAAQDAASVEALRAAPTILYGKPLSLARVAELDRALGGGRIRPLALAVSGASLYPEFRAQLAEWFQCAIIDAYIATESGPIAIDCEHQTGMHVLDDRVVVEIELADGRLAAEGSGVLVVTNLTNWAHAFVRYRLGDRCTIASRACACGFTGQTIIALPGREVAHYDVRGVGRVDSARLEAILLRPDLQQFEVAEPTAGNLLVRWIRAPGCDVAAVTAHLRSALSALLGDAFELRQVDRITVAGGKALRFVREPRFP